MRFMEKTVEKEGIECALSFMQQSAAYNIAHRTTHSMMECICRLEHIRNYDNPSRIAELLSLRNLLAVVERVKKNLHSVRQMEETCANQLKSNSSCSTPASAGLSAEIHGILHEMVGAALQEVVTRLRDGDESVFNDHVDDEEEVGEEMHCVIDERRKRTEEYEKRGSFERNLLNLLHSIVPMPRSMLLLTVTKGLFCYTDFIML